MIAFVYLIENVRGNLGWNMLLLLFKFMLPSVYQKSFFS